jgi:hypothetical protein
MNAQLWPSNPDPVLREQFGIAETPAEWVIFRPRLYLESTIPSYLTARPSRDPLTAYRQQLTLRWWNSWRTNFDIYISEYVLSEVALGNPMAAERRKRVLAPLKELKANNRTESLYKTILTTSGLPKRASTDAAHVAVAAVHKMQYLLTWNCAHLANPYFASRIKNLCAAEGCTCPTLCTPEQLLESYEHPNVPGTSRRL